MLKYLLRQPVNTWKTLGRLHKIEIILLIALIYIFLIGRIHHSLLQLLELDWVTPFGLSNLMTHVFVISFFLAGPFILKYLLPRQSGVLFFRSKPLNKKQLFELLGYFYSKYQIISIFIYFLFLTALVGINWAAAITSLTILVGYSVTIFLLQVELFVSDKKKPSFLIKNFILFLIYSAAYAITYWYISQPWIFDGVILLSGTFLAINIYKKIEKPQLEFIIPQKQKWSNKSSQRGLSFANIPHFLPLKTQVLFNKEFLSLWRNPSYRRLKFITLILYVLLLFVLLISQIDNKEIWMTLLTGVIIWIHYSNFFNEKYVQPEPEWYFHTMPFRFHHVWLSKFLVEFFFIFLLLVSFWIFILVTGVDVSAQLNLLGLLLIFSFLVLAIILNFQIMFFDDPRLAGYAYHFTIIFLLIMSINYRFVGPVISLFLLTFYFYKSYRYFNS